MLATIQAMFEAHPFWFLILVSSIIWGIQGLFRAILRVPSSPIITIQNDK